MTRNTVRKDLKSILDQIRKAKGWQVIKLGSDHFQVVNPQGKALTFPATPGQQSAIRIAEAKLKTLGWDPVAIEAQKTAASKAKMDEVRAIEAEQMAEAVRMANARYEEERTKLVGRLRPGSRIPGTKDEYVGFERVVRVVTPFEAKVMLEMLKTSECNRRRVKVANVNDLEGIYRRGHYQFSPENVVLDEHGCLVNGKHRMEALARCNPEELERIYGVPGLVMEIVVNAPAELNSVYDTGVSRTAADILSNNGVEKYQAMASSALRLLMTYDAKYPDGRPKDIDPREWRRTRYAKDEILEAYRTTYPGLLDQPLKDALILQRSALKMTPSVALAFTYIIHRDWPEGDEKYLNKEGHETSPWQEFFVGCLTGFNLPPGDPRVPFRDYMLNPINRGRTMSPVIQLGVSLKTFLKWRAGERAYLAKFSITEKIPRIAGKASSAMPGVETL